MFNLGKRVFYLLPGLKDLFNILPQKHDDYET